jgi:hypothetical protein
MLDVVVAGGLVVKVVFGSLVNFRTGSGVQAIGIHASV